MGLVHKIESWGDTHHPGYIDILRIALGIFLLLKGIAFMQNTNYLKELIENQDTLIFPSSLLMAIVYYVTFTHMVGGTLIAMGILTRLSCLLQIPIVVGAVFLVNIFESPINGELSLSIIALVLLCIFTIIGSGPVSLDKYLTD
jgi:uncharacterized membrane protein YphA (DoxX/SURF4 family)